MPPSTRKGEGLPGRSVVPQKLGTGHLIRPVALTHLVPRHTPCSVTVRETRVKTCIRNPVLQAPHPSPPRPWSLPGNSSRLKEAPGVDSASGPGLTSVRDPADGPGAPEGCAGLHGQEHGHHGLLLCLKRHTKCPPSRTVQEVNPVAGTVPFLRK